MNIIAHTSFVPESSVPNCDETSQNLSNDKDMDPSILLNRLRCKNIDGLLIGHLNVNSIRNKFHNLSDLIKGKIDLLLVSETKINASFPSNQFKIPGYQLPYRRDRTIHGENGGGMLFYISDNIPSKQLENLDFSIVDIESMFIEINLRNVKWLISCNYNPCKSMIANHLCQLSKYMDFYLSKYDNIILLGDFNSENREPEMSNFCETYNLKSLNNKPTCFKNVTNPTNIDLILTNKQKMFKNTMVIETGLSDFHKLTVTALKSKIKKKTSKTNHL